MNEKDKAKVENVIQDIGKVHSKMSERESYKSFLSFSHKTFSDNGAVSAKNKDLIAIGIAIAINCDPCVLFHIRNAFMHKATEEEILEAIEIGYEMGGGPAVIKSSFAFKVLDYYNEFGKIY